MRLAKEFGAPEAAHDGLFSRCEGFRRLPEGWAHCRRLSCLDHCPFPAYAAALPLPSPLHHYLIGVPGPVMPKHEEVGANSMA